MESFDSMGTPGGTVALRYAQDSAAYGGRIPRTLREKSFFRRACRRKKRISILSRPESANSARLLARRKPGRLHDLESCARDPARAGTPRVRRRMTEFISGIRKLK